MTNVINGHVLPDPTDPRWYPAEAQCGNERHEHLRLGHVQVCTVEFQVLIAGWNLLRSIDAKALKHTIHNYVMAVRWQFIDRLVDDSVNGP